MRKAFLHILGSRIGLWLMQFANQSERIDFSNRIYRNTEGSLMWEICVNGICVEFAISEREMTNIIERLGTRFHQVRGVVFTVRHADFDVRGVSFTAQLSW